METKFNKFKILENEKIKKLLEEYVPFELKKYTSLIEDMIPSGNTSFNIFVDFTNELGISFNLIVNFEKSNNINYHSEVNLFEAIKKQYKNFDIFINVKDKEINISELMANIHHELKHILDSIAEDGERFLNDFLSIPTINYFKDNNSIIRDFDILMYLYVEHEISARNSMLWNKFKRLGIYDKEILMDRFKKSYIYDALMKLKDFNALKFINSRNKQELLKLTNEFLTGLNKPIIKFSDLYNYYKKWQDLFKERADKYLTEVPEIIDELIKDIKPYMENNKNDKYIRGYCCINCNHPFFYINVLKDILDKNIL